MRLRPMAPIALSFAAGILAAEYVPLPILCAAAALGLCTAVLLRGSGHRALAGIISALFLLGAFRYSQAIRVGPHDVSRSLAQATGIEGCVASDPEPDSDRLRFVLRARGARIGGQWRDVEGLVMTTVYRDAGSGPPLPEYGDRVRIRARLYPPMEPTNPGRFSWKAYLRRQGIHACATVRDQTGVTILRGEQGSRLVRAALAVRHTLANSIARVYGRHEAPVISGMVLGTYAYLSPDTFSDFSRTGTLHLLAASGFNCWLLLLLATPALKAVRVRPQYRGLAAIVLICGYVLVAGGKPSLVRAALMASLLLLASPLRRVGEVGNLFFAAMFVILLTEPADLFDVGFQLSFLAVLALVVVAPILYGIADRANRANAPALRRAGRTERWIRRRIADATSVVVSTIAISLVTGPAVAFYFNYVSLVSVPANLALATGVIGVFAAGLVAPLAAHLSTLAPAIGAVGTWLMQGMLGVVHGLGTLRHAAVSVSSPGPLAIAGYYVLLYTALSHLRSKYAHQ